MATQLNTADSVVVVCGRWAAPLAPSAASAQAPTWTGSRTTLSRARTPLGAQTLSQAQRTPSRMRTPSKTVSKPVSLGFSLGFLSVTVFVDECVCVTVCCVRVCVCVRAFLYVTVWVWVCMHIIILIFYKGYVLWYNEENTDYFAAFDFSGDPFKSEGGFQSDPFASEDMFKDAFPSNTAAGANVRCELRISVIDVKPIN